MKPNNILLHPLLKQYYSIFANIPPLVIGKYLTISMLIKKYACSTHEDCELMIFTTYALNLR